MIKAETINLGTGAVKRTYFNDSDSAYAAVSIANIGSCNVMLSGGASFDSCCTLAPGMVYNSDEFQHNSTLYFKSSANGGRITVTVNAVKRGSTTGFCSKRNVAELIDGDTSILSDIAKLKEEKADKTDIAGLASGTPAFASQLSDMKDKTRLYVLKTDGMIYSYSSNSNTFESTGVLYSGNGVSDGEITEEKLSEELNASIRLGGELNYNLKDIVVNYGIVPKYGWKYGGVLHEKTGSLVVYNGSYNDEKVSVTPGTVYYGAGDSDKLSICFFNAADEFISNIRVKYFTKITVPQNASYARFSALEERIEGYYDSSLPRVLTAEEIEEMGNIKCSGKFSELIELPLKSLNPKRLMLRNTSYMGVLLSVEGGNKAKLTPKAASGYEGVYIKADFEAGDILKIRFTEDDEHFVPKTVNLFSISELMTGSFKGQGSCSVNNGEAVFTLREKISTYLVTYSVENLTPSEMEVTVNDTPISTEIVSKAAAAYNRTADVKRNINFITLGDSITSLGGRDGKSGWLKYFIEKTNAELIANLAVSGAVLADRSAEAEYDGTPTADYSTLNVLGNQVYKLVKGSYAAPDLILISIGTNGGVNTNEDEIYSTYYNSDGSAVDIAQIDRTSDSGAFRWCNAKLKEKYPNALIVWCTPVQAAEALRSLKDIKLWGDNIKLLTQYGGIECIDTMRCGIWGCNEKEGEEGEYLADGLHPNERGFKKIGYYNASRVLNLINTLEV